MKLQVLCALVIPVFFGLSLYFWHSDAFKSEAAQALDMVVEAIPLLAPEPVTILFTGDVMFDRGVRRHAASYGDDSLFAGVKQLFLGADAVVVNLETTLTDRPSVASVDSSRLEFTSDPRFADMLASLNVRVATLSNNHTDDFGTDGLATTRGHLTFAEIGYHGSPHNMPGEYTLETFVRELRTCYVGYQGFIYPDPTPIADEIRRIRPNCDYLVATMHAGDEYVYTANAIQTRAAHAFVDAGADVVIGTHPHVVQPVEIYKGKPIFYSLGNAMFDQDFSWETTHAVLVEATVSEDLVEYRIVPISVEKAEASVVTDSKTRDRLLNMLVGPATPAEVGKRILSTASFIIK